jgi:HEAT repeat protein
MTAAELLAESVPVAQTLASALGKPGVGVIGHLMVHDLIRRSNLHDGLVNALASPNPLTRASAARICAAARIPDSVVWLGDMLQDPTPRVRDAGVRALAQLGGRRAVELLMDASNRIPQYRLAIALARAASDVDIEALMRRPDTEGAAVATVLACGLRRDVLRVPPLLGIAHDRRWPKQVRKAACKALAMIGDRAAADGLKRLALYDPDPDVKATAGRAHERLVKKAISG